MVGWLRRATARRREKALLSISADAAVHILAALRGGEHGQFLVDFLERNALDLLPLYEGADAEALVRLQERSRVYRELVAVLEAAPKQSADIKSAKRRKE